MTTNEKFYESEFEQAFVEMLTAEGWTHSCGEELAGRLLTEPLYTPDLRDYLRASYALGDADVESLIARLRNESATTDYLAARAVWRLIVDGDNFMPQGESESIHIQYVDFEHPKNNIFRCVNQYEMHQGTENRRPDIVLMVNGIPLCIIELKNPTNKTADIGEAHEQICRTYREAIPVLMKYTAIAVISDAANTRMGSQFTPFEYFYAWKKVNAKDDAGRPGLDQLQTMISGALAPGRLIDIYRDYIFFPDTDTQDKELEIVCRYPQYFATSLLLDSIKRAMRRCGGNGQGGTYFGATGCGKTYTMLFLARQLMRRSQQAMDSPTVLIIVDRTDLQDQSEDVFTSAKDFLGDINLKVFDNRTELENELKERKGGGLYITTIQKFTESTGLLSPRDNIICMSDEAHRSQTNIGERLKINSSDRDPKKLGAFFTQGFAQYLHTALPNATYVGFTGTPIDDTIKVFGAVVDSYTMKQAERDQITVPIAYNSRLARVYLHREEAERVEAYYRQCEEDGASPEDVQRSREAMAQMREILKAPERLHRIAADIVEHYESQCDTQPELLQKAMIVSSDRYIAYDLYREIARLRPEWVEAQTEKVENDDEPGKKTKTKTKTKTGTIDVAKMQLICTRDKKRDPKELYDLLGDDEHRKALAVKFKKEDSVFRIAIVVDMWITGFDVPCLSVLYNDKPLSRHTLIQTISRVNRKYKSKETGLVIDYIGIRDNMKKALRLYGGDGETTTSDEQAAYSTFLAELEMLDAYTRDLDFTPFWGENALCRLQFLQRAAEYLLTHHVEGSETLTTLYKGHVRRMKLAYNIVRNAVDEAGNPILSDDENRKAQCHMGICAFVSKMTDSQHDVRSMNRAVEEMVAEAIGCDRVMVLLEKDGSTDNIYSDEFMREVEGVDMPATQFQLLASLLRREIRDYSKINQSRAQHFADMLAQVIDEYNSRTFSDNVANDTITAITDEMRSHIMENIEQLRQMKEELDRDKKRFKDLGITFEEMAFYDILCAVRDNFGFDYADERCKELAKKVKQLVDNQTVYADFLNNDNLKASLMTELKRLLRRNGYPPMYVPDVYKNIIEQVTNYKRGTSTPPQIVLKAETVKVEAGTAEVKSEKVKLYSETVEPYGMMMAADSGMDKQAAETWQCDRKFTPNAYDKYFHQALDMEHVKIGIYRVMNSKGYNGQRQFDKVYHWFVVFKVLREIDWIDDEFQNKDFYEWLQLSFGCKFGKGNYDKVDSLYKETKSKLWKENMPHGKSFVDLAAALRRELRGNEDKYKVRPDLYIWHPSEDKDKN